MAPYREGSGRVGAVRCLYCGATLDGATAACARCGVDARGSSTRVIGSNADGVACPRCTSLHLAPITVEPAGIAMQECAGCHGLLVSPSAWTQMFDAVEAGQPVGVGRFVPLKPGAVAPPLLAFVHCPVCNVEMDRVAFAARSRIIIDVCAAHGVWLDAAELAPILLHFQRVERGEVENDAPPSGPGSLEAESLRAQVAAAEREFDALYERGNHSGRDSWSGRTFTEDLAVAHRRLRELRECLVAVQAADRAREAT
jgi:Zn-finger nucleic acid-binding protein